LVML